MWAKAQRAFRPDALRGRAGKGASGGGRHVQTQDRGVIFGVSHASTIHTHVIVTVSGNNLRNSE